MDHLAFGLRDGRMVSVSEVDSGLDCNCTCAACSGRLVARKGRVRRQHFAHHSRVECPGAQETAIHLFAKQSFLEEKVLSLPELSEWEFVGGLRLGAVAVPAQQVAFEAVELEVQRDGYVPDAVGWIRNRSLIVEFRNTHQVDDDKRRRIAFGDVSAIEIDLRPLLGLDTLSAEDILHAAPRTWVHHPRMRKLSRYVAEQVRREEERLRREERMDRVSSQAEEIVTLLADLRTVDRTSGARDIGTFDRNLFTVHGLWGLVGRRFAGDWCFSVSSHRWQVGFLNQFVVSAATLRKQRVEIPMDALSKWLVEQSYVVGDLIYMYGENRDHLLSSVSDFRFPVDIFEAYLLELEEAGLIEITSASGKDRTVVVVPEVLESIRRGECRSYLERAASAERSMS